MPCLPQTGSCRLWVVLLSYSVALLVDLGPGFTSSVHWQRWHCTGACQRGSHWSIPLHHSQACWSQPSDSQGIWKVVVLGSMHLAPLDIYGPSFEAILLTGLILWACDRRNSTAPMTSKMVFHHKQQLYSVHYPHGVNTRSHPGCFFWPAFLLYFLQHRLNPPSPASLLIRNSIFKPFFSSHILS